MVLLNNLLIKFSYSFLWPFWREKIQKFFSFTVFFFVPRRLPQSQPERMGKFGKNSWRGTDDPFAESLEEVFTGVHCSNQAVGGFYKEEKTKMLVLGFTLLTEQKEKFICISPTPSIFGRTTKSSGFENMSMYHCWLSLSFQNSIYEYIHTYIFLD